MIADATFVPAHIHMPPGMYLRRQTAPVSVLVGASPDQSPLCSGQVPSVKNVGIACFCKPTGDFCEVLWLASHSCTLNPSQMQVQVMARSSASPTREAARGKGPAFLLPGGTLFAPSFPTRWANTRLRDGPQPAARHGQRHLCLWLRYVQPSSHQWSSLWAGARSPGTRHYRLVTLLLPSAGT